MLHDTGVYLAMRLAAKPPRYSRRQYLLAAVLGFAVGAAYGALLIVIGQAFPH